MIAKIRGTIEEIREKYMLIETASGLTYKVFSTPQTLSLCTSHTETSLWTFFIVRETTQDLYGFKEKDELDFFELLIGISGIGPKGALGILSVADTQTLRHAISSGDITYLTKVSGIGKKSAEKIVLELRDKIGAIDSEFTGQLKEDTEATEALIALGYSQQEARDSLRAISSDIVGVSDRVREALKNLGT